MITEILSFLQIFSVRKTTTQYFKYFRKTTRESTKNYISDIFWTFMSKLQIIHVTNYIHCFFLILVNVFFHIFSTIHPYLFLLFSHLCSCFHLFFFLPFSPRDTFYNLQCLIRFHYNLPVISQRQEETLHSPRTKEKVLR